MRDRCHSPSNIKPLLGVTDLAGLNVMSRGKGERYAILCGVLNRCIPEIAEASRGSPFLRANRIQPIDPGTRKAGQVGRPGLGGLVTRYILPVVAGIRDCI